MLTILQRLTTMIAIFEPLFCKVYALEKQGQRYGRFKQCRTGLWSVGMWVKLPASKFEGSRANGLALTSGLLLSGPSKNCRLDSPREKLNFPSYVLLERDFCAG